MIGINRRYAVLAALLVVASAALVACGDDEEGGDATAPTPPPEATVTDSGLQIIDITLGDGEEAAADSTVTFHYTGKLLDGTEFDSSAGGDPITYPLADLIPGWQEGIPGMKVGGQRQLIIPPELGYGEAGRPPAIPPNAWLVFDIELMGVP